MSQFAAFLTGPVMIGLGLALLGLGLLAFVTYKLGLVQKYIAFWHEATKNTGEGTVSAKRAVFIHGAAAGFVIVGTVLLKAGWIFTKESLSAFETLLYCTVGGYVGGKFAEVIQAKIAAKAQEPTP